MQSDDFLTDKVIRLSESNSRIETKMDALTDSVGSIVPAISRHEKVANRVLFYEKTILALVGASILAAVTGIIGKAIAAVDKLW